MKKVLLSIFFIITINFAIAENLNLYIKYLGIKMVNVNITDLDNKIITKAKSVGIAGMASKMDNEYICSYDFDYLPTNYTKHIKQKDYFEERSTDYLRDKKIAVRTELNSSNEIVEYKINTLSRDFFSALFYLRTIEDLASGSIWLDANRSIWKAHYKLMGSEKIKTIFGKKAALKVKFSFEKISKLPKENTDMLTNNLVDEGKHLLFWFSDDEKRIPLRAEFNMKPFPVVWELENYEE